MGLSCIDLKADKQQSRRNAENLSFFGSEPITDSTEPVDTVIAAFESYNGYCSSVRGAAFQRRRCDLFRLAPILEPKRHGLIKTLGSS